jgi:hypothetical protein
MSSPCRDEAVDAPFGQQANPMQNPVQGAAAQHLTEEAPEPSAVAVAQP